MNGSKRSLQPLSRWLKLIGIVLLLFILWRIDFSTFQEHLLSCPPLFILLTFIIAQLAVAVKAFRWSRLLKDDGQHYPLGRAIVSYFTSVYIGMTTPGRLGEFSRVHYTKKDLNYPIGSGFATVIMDRLLDLYTFLIIGLIGIVRFGFLSSKMIGVEIALLIILLAPALLIHPKLGTRFVVFLSAKLTRTKYKAFIDKGVNDFYQTMVNLLSPKILISIALTALSYAMIFFGGYIITQGLKIDISIVNVALLIATSSLLGLIPITIAGIGTRDAIFIIGFSTLGLLEEQALAFSALVLITNHLGATLIGFVCFLIDKPPLPTNEKKEEISHENK